MSAIEKVNIPARKVEIEFNCELLIMDADIWGIAAAIAAEGQGVRVVLAEQGRSPYIGETGDREREKTIRQALGDGPAFDEALENLRSLAREIQGAYPPESPEIPQGICRMLITKLRESSVLTLYGIRPLDLPIAPGGEGHCLFYGSDRVFAVQASRVIGSGVNK